MTADETDSAPPGEALARYEAEVAQHYRWNLGAHLLYGLLGTTGWRLIMAPTFVPDYVYKLGGSNLLVGFLLFCGGVGRFVAPLVGAAYVAHRPLVKKITLRVGTGMRVQVLGMALSAFFLSTRWNLPVFFALYCFFNVFNGLQGLVFGVLMAKVIPLARRGRFIGIRDFSGGATAAAVVWAAGGLFSRLAFPASYGVTYLVAFAFTTLGLLCVATIREPRSPVEQEARSLGAMLASVGPLLRNDPGFAWYSAARGLGALGMMAAPYFIIAAGHIPGASATDLTHASVAYFGAATVANLAWGQIADRAGFRVVFLLAGMLWLFALGIATAATTLTMVPPLFLLVGAGQSGIQMASINMVYEFAAHRDLSVRLAVVSTLGELMGAIAPLLGGTIAERWSYGPLYGLAAFFTAASLLAMLRVSPRTNRRFGV